MGEITQLEQVNYSPGVLWQGDLQLKDVHIVDNGITWETDDPVINEEILKQKDRVMKDGILYCLADGLNSLEISDNGLSLRVGTCRYSDYIATINKPEQRETTSAIVISISVKTADEKIILGQRTKKTSLTGSNQQLGIFGGTFNADEVDPKKSTSPNILEQMTNLELIEELGIPERDYDIRLKGILNDSKFGNLRNIFLLETTLPYTEEEIRYFFQEQGSKDEHTDLEFYEDKQSAKDRLFITRERGDFTEATIASLFFKN